MKTTSKRRNLRKASKQADVLIFFWSFKKEKTEIVYVVVVVIER